MKISEHTFRSEVLGNDRRIWLQPSSASVCNTLWILLDGEYYVERMDTPRLTSDLPPSALPAFHVAYISHVDSATRWRESFCNDLFAQFLSQEIGPWCRRMVRCEGSNVRCFLGGLSLTGLAAAHAALVCPDMFSGALCQSASFWWSNDWLVSEVLRQDYPPQRFRITCGTHETQKNVDHGDGLFQSSSQLASNQAMRDVLIAKGHSVSYEEFDGGHDINCWKDDLPKSLRALML